MNDERFRLGLIGAGGCAQSYANAVRDLDDVKVVGVADVRLESAEALAENLGCPAYSSYQELVDENRCDGAIVCTPPASHHEICCDLLTRGIAVLCEKPLSTDSVSARAMLAEADRNGVMLTMASKFRHVTDIIRAKSIVASGSLGDIVLYENSFTSRVDMSRRWNSDPATSGGGVLIDNGTHSVDILRYFLGPIEAICAVEGKRIQNLAVEDTVRLHVVTATGALGSIDLSWSLSKGVDTFVDIYGSDGSLHVGWQSSSYRVNSSPTSIGIGSGYDKKSAFKSEIANFCLAVRRKEQRFLTAEDALASVLVIEAAYESLRTEGWVSIAPVGEVAGNT